MWNIPHYSKGKAGIKLKIHEGFAWNCKWRKKNISSVRVGLFLALVDTFLQAWHKFIIPCRVMVTCLTADPGVASSILAARSHTFVEIDHGHSIREGLLSVTSEIKTTKYWLTDY